LLNKLKRAAEEYNIKDIALAGGVSANTGLREGLNQTWAKKKAGTFLYPSLNTVPITPP
jgi:N6-L-threonylcarbamoyladenine synthase